MAGEEYVPETMYQRGEQFSVFVLDADDILDKHRHQLSGQIFTGKENGWVKVSEPLCHKDLIERIIHTMSPFINKVTFMSNLSEDRIDQQALAVEFNLTNLICDTADIYNTPATLFDILIDGAVALVENSLLKAMDEGERAFFKTTQSSKEQIVLKEGENKKSAMGFLRGE